MNSHFYPLIDLVLVDEEHVPGVPVLLEDDFVSLSPSFEDGDVLREMLESRGAEDIIVLGVDESGMGTYEPSCPTGCLWFVPAGIGCLVPGVAQVEEGVSEECAEDS